MVRSCDSCSKCCEWFEGTVHGKAFWPGRPCHYSCNGCTIYETRPENPCKSYSCMWLDNSIDFPEWIKPDKVNAIFTWKTVNGIQYMDLIEAGEIMRSDVLGWAILHAITNNMNFQFQIKGGKTRIGSPEFLALP